MPSASNRPPFRDRVAGPADVRRPQLLQAEVADAPFVELFSVDRDEAVDEVLDSARLGLLQDHDDIRAGPLDEVLLEGHDELFHLETVLVGHALQGVDDEERLLRERPLDAGVDVLDLGHRAPLEERLQGGAVDARRRPPFLAEGPEDLLSRPDLPLLGFGQRFLGGLPSGVDRVQEQLRRIEDAGAHLTVLQPGELPVERLVADPGGEVVRPRRLADPFEEFESERRFPRSGSALDDQGPPALPTQEGDDLRWHAPDRAAVVCAHALASVHGRIEGPGARESIPYPEDRMGMVGK